MIADLRKANGWSLGDAATLYLAIGLPVLPCKPGAKLPLTRHGFKSALDPSTVPEEIRHLLAAKVRDWINGTSSNVAIATGARVDVLDVDVRNGKPGRYHLRQLEKAGLLDGAVAHAVTPSGGTHIYFPAGGIKSRALGDHGLDLKARGGYVLASPSSILDVTPDGDVATPRYLWTWSRPVREGRSIDWDACLAALGVERPQTRAARVTGMPVSDVVDGLARWIVTQPNNRNSALFWAAHRAVEEGVTTVEQLKPLVDASLALSEPGEDREEELWKTARSALSQP